MAGTASGGGRNFSFKVVLLGEGCVGKTSLVLRYIENKFNDKHLTTLQDWPALTISEEKSLLLQSMKRRAKYFRGFNYPKMFSCPNFIMDPSETTASFLNKKLNIGGKRVNLSIWDTAGQERFHALGPIYYRDSNGAILVYDITDEDSFQKVKNWVKELRKMLGNDICLCIAGNKIDLEKERHVSVTEAESYATSVGAQHFHTSAKLNKGIEELFLDLSKAMIQRAGEDSQKNSKSGRKSVLVVDDEEPQQQQSGGGCCG